MPEYFIGIPYVLLALETYDKCFATSIGRFYVTTENQQQNVSKQKSDSSGIKFLTFEKISQFRILINIIILKT